MKNVLPILLAAFPLLRIPAHGTTDADWNVANPTGVASTNGAVEAIAYGNRTVFIAGKFTVAGASLARNVAQWDGTKWSALDSGLGGPVHTLCYGKDGLLYASGDFIASGKAPCRNIAVWDGKQWSGLGAGLDKAARFLSMDGQNRLYAAGDQIMLSNNIAVWSGGKWDSLPRFAGRITALAAGDSGKVYLGESRSTYALGNAVWGIIGLNGGENLTLALDKAGSLHLASGNMILKYSGTSLWGTRFQSVTGPIRALAIDSGGSLVFGGRFDTASQVACRNVAVLSDTTALPLGTGLDDTVKALVAGDSGSLFAQGRFRESGGTQVEGIAQWDGKRWGGFGEGMDGVVEAVGADGDGNVYVAGGFTRIGGVAANHIAMWDGHGWKALGAGLGRREGASWDKMVESIVCGKGGAVYVGGRFATAGGKAIRNIAKWNGTDWDSLPAAQASATGLEVMAMAFDTSGNLFLGGRFDSTFGRQIPLAKWDGETLQLVDPDTARYSWIENFAALAFDSKGSLYVGGRFGEVGGVATSGIIKWDGNAWTALDSGFYGSGKSYITQVNALTCVNDTVYIGGRFLQAGTTPMQNVAFWDGSKLKSAGKGIANWGQVFAMEHDSRGRVFIGGLFESASGLIARNIACWNGSKWFDLGSGTDGKVAAMGISDSTLYVGGSFAIAGGRVSPYLASMNLNAATTRAIGNATAASAGIHFRRSGTRLFIANVRSSDIVSLYSASGRRLFEGKGSKWIDLSRVPGQAHILGLRRRVAGGGMAATYTTLF